MAEGRPRNALIALDLLRFAAAAMVMAFHYGVVWMSDDSPLTIRLLAGVDRHGFSDPVSRNGWVGVEIFFVLSGYVIAMSARGASAGDFAWRRMLRLWPGALVCASLTAVALWASGVPLTQVAPAWIASGMLWPGTPQVDGSYWTLGVEIAFYALVAALLAAGRWRPLAVARVLMAGGLLFWGWSLATGFAGMALRERWQELLLLRHGCLFALGIMIEERHRTPAAVDIAAMAPAFLCGAIAVWFTALATAAGGHLPPTPLAAVTIYAAGVAVVALAPRLQPTLARWRLARPAVALGLATYPLYLLHQRIGHVLIGHVERAGVPHGATLMLVAAAMIGASLVVATRVEPWIRAAFRRWRSAFAAHRSRPAVAQKEASIA